MSSETIVHSLEEVMRREVTILRELLSSLREEQDALLHGDVARVRTVTNSRVGILEAMADARAERLALVDALGEITAEHCQAVVLRGQLVELIESVRIQTIRNNRLLEGKLRLTHQMIQYLQPKDRNQIYGAKGQVKKTLKTATKTLINREV